MRHDFIDAESTACDARSRHATREGAPAFTMLLALAEQSASGQIPRIARFLAATYNGQAFPLDLFELRAVDIAISDDMLCCLDALRWGRADLYTLIPEGDARVRAVIEHWGPVLARRSLIDEPRPIDTLKTRGPASPARRNTAPCLPSAVRRAGPAPAR